VIVETVREDPEFLDIAGALGPMAAMRFMTGPSGAQAGALKAMEPFYLRARKERALRPGITLDDMESWLRLTCSPLTTRTDLDPDELRAWLAKFALPPLLTEGHLKRSELRRTPLP
jgi:hypothetical protein